MILICFVINLFFFFFSDAYLLVVTDLGFFIFIFYFLCRYPAGCFVIYLVFDAYLFCDFVALCCIFVPVMLIICILLLGFFFHYYD